MTAVAKAWETKSYWFMADKAQLNLYGC